LRFYRIQPNSEKLCFRETHFITSQLGESPRDFNERRFISIFIKSQKNEKPHFSIKFTATLITYLMYITKLTFSCLFSANSTPPKSLMQVPSLLQEYKGCLATRKFDEAEKISKEINYFITNEINTTAFELWRFAYDLLQEAGCIEESVPVWFVAASLYKKEGDLQWMGWCVGDWYVGGMYEANITMIKRDVTMKDVVKRHVIPLMRDIKNQMLEVTSVSEKDKCEWMSHVLEFIAMSDELVDDDVAAKEAREESRVWKERLRELEEESESSEEEESETFSMQ